MKYNTLLSLFTLFIATAGTTPVNAENSIYHRLAQEYLPSLAHELKAEKKNEKTLKQENKEASIAYKFGNIKPPIIGEAEKIKLLYGMATQQAEEDVQPPLLPTVCKDLELFTNTGGNPTRSVFSSIDRTKTTAGKIALQKMLLCPLSDIEQLQARQAIVKELISNKELFEQLDEQLDRIKQHENDMIWFWKDLDTEVHQHFDTVYFTHEYLTPLNKKSIALSSWSRFCTVVLPGISLYAAWYIFSMLKDVVYYTYHYENDTKKQCLNYGYVGFMTLYFSILNKLTINKAIDTCTTENGIHEKMAHVHSYIDSIRSLATTVSSTAGLNHYEATLALKPSQEQQAQELLEVLDNGCFDKEPSIIRNKGVILSSFKMMFDAKDNLIPAMLASGEVDAYLSIAKLYKENETHPRAPYCFAEFESGVWYEELCGPNNIIDARFSPVLNITNLWHPFINQDCVVTNSIKLGSTSRPKDMLLTGPNAGGKSTILKSIAVAVILAQTFGIAPAQEIRLTPFHTINTYLNIPDATGQESLFQAEMRRAHELLDSITHLKEKQCALSIMDEIFTGTNPEEGRAGAYGITRALSEMRNSINIITTHYKELTRLEVETGGTIKNFKVSVIEYEDGSIEPTYKLEPGISHQQIALKLLKNSKLNATMIDYAYQAFNQ